MSRRPSPGPVAAASQPAGLRRDPPRLTEVLEVAARLFNTRGYRATSLNDIAAELGINKASLYHYVASKQELLHRLILRAAQALREARLDPRLETAPPREALEMMVRTHCGALLARPDEFGTLILQRRHLDAEALEPIRVHERDYYLALRRLIRRGIVEGAFRPDLDDGVATLLVLDAANGLVRWYRPEGRLSGPAVTAQIWAFVRAALCPDEARP